MISEAQIIIHRKNIKNLYIRVISAEQILVTCNKNISDADISRFIESKKNWINKCLEKLKNAEPAEIKRIENGSNIILAENVYPLAIEKSKSNSIKLVNGKLLMNLRDTSDDETKKKLLLKWYKTAFYNYAAERINQILRENKKYILRCPSKISVKNTLTRWGSYSKKTNTVALSIRLGSYSKTAIDSVIYHELAHTRYMDHQKDFYRLLYNMIPSYREGHKELKIKKSKEHWYLI